MVGREVVPHRRIFIELNADVEDLKWWEDELDIPYSVNSNIKSSQIELRTASLPLVFLGRSVEWPVFGAERTC